MRDVGDTARPPGRGRAADALTVGLAAAGAAALAMALVKLVCVGAIASSEIGRKQLVGEIARLGFLAWPAEDLALAALWGLVAAPAGLPRSRPGRSAAAAVLAVAGVALGLALALAAIVYWLFGVPPTWQILGTLSDASNFRDSLASLAGPGPILVVVAIVTAVVGGTPALARRLRRRPPGRHQAAIGAVGLAVVVGAGAIATPSRFELDRNPLLLFARTAVEGQPVAADAKAGAAGDWGDVLAPVAERPKRGERAELGYVRLEEWIRRHEQPNVVLVVLETTAVSQMGLFGGPVPNTPTLSGLADRGLLWDHHYAHTPSSMFALYQILCANHGRPGEAHISVNRPRIDCGALSEVLVSRGYRAGLFHSGRFSYSQKDKFLSGRGYSIMLDAIAMPNRDDYVSGSWGIEERATIDAMLDWIEHAGDDEPLFLTYVPVYPHHPYEVPHDRYREFDGDGAKARYRNAIYYVDQMVAELLARFDDAGVAADTLFVFVGDHGEGFGEHPGSKLHGSKLYDEAVRSFALWYAPGALGRGVRDSRPLGHASLAPTLLDLLGAPPRSEHPMPPATATGPRPMVPLYTGYGHPLVGFVDGPWKFLLNRRTGQSELFHLGRDPGETSSVAGEHPDAVATYTERARQFVATQRAWEDALPDRERPAHAQRPGRSERAIVDPAACDFPASHFAVTDGKLHLTRSAEKSVRCRVAIPDGPGALTGLEIRGNEGLNAAFITTTVTWVRSSAHRRQLAYCRMSGNRNKKAHTCSAEILPERAEWPSGGGQLQVEIRYVTPADGPKFELFGIDEVELRYRAFDD